MTMKLGRRRSAGSIDECDRLLNRTTRHLLRA
jgi:hypothetical protein